VISLKGKVTLITGGSRGIGRAVAMLFAKAGSDLVVNYRADREQSTGVADMARKLGVRALEIKADIADRKQVDGMVKRVIAEFGHIDILVNNAGVWVRNPIDKMSEELLKETIDINLMGTFYTCMTVAPHMIERKSGTIINISSTAGQRGEARYSPYAATKGAVISLTKSLATELAPHSIRVNCVAPGWVDTDMSHEALVGADRDWVMGQIPLGRAASADELAGPVLFMASDMASFITGEILNVNGGAVLCG